jgi:hypothetical protein
MIQQSCKKVPRRRGPSLETLIFKMGGFNGAVRRIIARCERPFTVNQIKVAIVRRHPELIPAQSQVEDILAELVRTRKLESTDEGSYRPVKHQVHYPKFIQARVSHRKHQLKFIFR